MDEQIPILLVTLSAALHAWWNYLVKRTGTGDVAVVWLFSVLGLPITLALTVWGIVGGWLGPAWWAALVSMVLHTTYSVVLQRSYARSDLSVVYPVSRGAAPLLVLVLSLPVVGAPGPWEVVGIALVVVGLVVMSGLHVPGHGQGPAVASGLLVAGCIAAYTLWDAYAVTSLDVSLAAYFAISGVAQSTVLSIIVAPRRRELPTVVRTYWRTAILVTVLTPASYLLVLVAMQHAPVAVVAAARSLNVVFATVLGMVLLREPRTPSTLTGTACILAGVLAMAGAG